jgi:hypothetical protein
LDIPLSFNASYCFSFLTFARCFGMGSSFDFRGPDNIGRLPGAELQETLRPY